MKLFFIVCFAAFLVGCGHRARGWEYKVETFDDDWAVLRKNAAPLPENDAKEILKRINDDMIVEKEMNGRFGLLTIPPNDWELCGSFTEPHADHPKLVCIFRRPAK